MSKFGVAQICSKMNKNELNRVDDNPEKMKNSGAKKM
jgi:hypothetical protein